MFLSDEMKPVHLRPVVPVQEEPVNQVEQVLKPVTDEPVSMEIAPEPVAVPAREEPEPMQTEAAVVTKSSVDTEMHEAAAAEPTEAVLADPEQVPETVPETATVTEEQQPQE